MLAVCIKLQGIVIPIAQRVLHPRLESNCKTRIDRKSDMIVATVETDLLSCILGTVVYHEIIDIGHNRNKLVNCSL